MIFRAVGAGLLVLGLSFLLFGLGFYVEGMVDLSDGRMDGHASLDLSQDVAIRFFWRRVWISLAWSGALLLSGLSCFWMALALSPRKPDEFEDEGRK